MKYKVLFPSTSIQKKFEKNLEEVFPAKLRLEIMDEVERLSEKPRPYGVLKLKPPPIVYSMAAQYRVRIGDFRVLYDIDDTKKTVWILALRRRGEDTYF